MKFETIKDNAKKLFCGAMNSWPWMGTVDAHLGLGTLGKGGGPAFEALLPFVLATENEREEMRLFAEAYKAKRGDWLAHAAKAEDASRMDVAWNQTVLRAREAGLDLIDGWDIRMVGKLIELFPDCVPSKYRNKSMLCYMADNEDCDWMIEFKDGPPADIERSRPSMRG
jgi:hypothetical protein